MDLDQANEFTNQYFGLVLTPDLQNAVDIINMHLVSNDIDLAERKTWTLIENDSINPCFRKIHARIFALKGEFSSSLKAIILTAHLMKSDIVTAYVAVEWDVDKGLFSSMIFELIDTLYFASVIENRISGHDFKGGIIKNIQNGEFLFRKKNSREAIQKGIKVCKLDFHEDSPITKAIFNTIDLIT